jgi:hypothetical protein
MAKIVFGMGTSHGPMLSTPPELWGKRVAADKKNPALMFRGKKYVFDELVAIRKDENLGAQSGLEEWTARNERCQHAIARLSNKLKEVNPDVVVIVGNDQREIYAEDNMPSLCVFWGDTIFDMPSTEEQKAKMPPGIAVASAGHKPNEYTEYPCHPELGLHIIKTLIQNEFDVAQSQTLPQEGAEWASGAPHSLGFIYHQIMKEEVIPHVPIITNTFFPPNQPSAARCYKLGKTIKKAVESWDSDARVAIIGSGGMSHFVIDEVLDGQLLDAMQSQDEAALAGIPESFLQSGSSETKNWIAMSGAMDGTGLNMELVDYVPCYRSEAGTGTAQGFAYWE